MKINDVSKMYEISQDTLRYYEKIGLIPPVNRSKNGIRDYNEEDCRWVEYIKCMRGAGLPIETLIEYVDLSKKGDKTVDQRKEILQGQRKDLINKIAELQETLKRLDFKIERYEKMVEKEKTLKGN
ncbi:MerR family transcriptional regulator [uncultured Clostridium sp.]|uniref:MerR family transcriptional regulator n=1 Tax=uncultured Clostridium sp. TaxID=59620 RepID=UPI0026027B56|nr:MerR family transcriptional regulator [uncultured Clostridium sp.]